MPPCPLNKNEYLEERLRMCISLETVPQKGPKDVRAIQREVKFAKRLLLEAERR